MTTSDENAPLFPRSIISPKHPYRHNSIDAGFPLIVADHLTHVQDLKSDSAQVSKALWLYHWLEHECAVPFTLLMSALGAGTLAIPYTFVLLSPLQAVLVLSFVGMAMAFTADTLVDIYVIVAKDDHTQLQASQKSYQQLAWKAGGKCLARVTGALTAFAVFGACVGCVCVIKDMAPILLSALPHHFDQQSLEEKQHAVVISTWLIVMSVVLPLGCLTNISALRYSSYFGVVFSVYLVSAVAYRAATGNTGNSTILDGAQNAKFETEIKASLFWRLSEVVGIYNFTFMLHLNVIPLLAQLVAADMAKQSGRHGITIEALESTKVPVTVLQSARLTMRRHLALAVGACVLLYAIFGLCAAHMYGHQTQGNILLNLSNDRIMAVPRMAILLTILFSYPLLFHPLRSLVLEMYVACVDCHGCEQEENEESTSKPSRIVQAIVTVLLLALQVLCALRVPGLHVVFSFVGASNLLMLCYLFPLIFYFRLAPWRSNRAKMARLALLILVGVVATLYCVAATCQVILSV